MDIRDYLRMLRRGWPTVLAFTMAFTGLAWIYLQTADKVFEATSQLFVSISDPQSVTDLQQGAVFSTNTTTTYAQIIDSSTVLGRVAEKLQPQADVDRLVDAVSASPREGTTLIDIAVSGNDPARVAAIADATAQTAAEVLPSLTVGPTGNPLVRITQIRPAVEPMAPVAPRASRVLVIGMVVGLVVGLAMTILLQALDTRIRRVEDLRLLTEIPVLGAIPGRRRRQRAGIATRDHPAPAVVEAFRTLRTNVRFLDIKKQRSLVVVAVANHLDGAQVPVNLGWMLAEAGHRVIVVDLDLRQSALAESFGLSLQPGASDVLADSIPVGEAVQTVRSSRLDVLTSGTARPNPSELLNARLLSSLLRKLEATYDYVIVHAAPLLSYTDAAVIAGLTGGTLVSVSTGRTRAQELTAAFGALANVGVVPLGIVMTRTGSHDLRPPERKSSGLLERVLPGRTNSHRVDWDWRKKPPDASGRHSVA